MRSRPCSNDKEWERIFGSEEDRKKRFKKAVEEQKKREAPEQRRNVYNGVTDDRLYNQQYDRGAGRKWSGYAERKAWMDKKGVDCE